MLLPVWCMTAELPLYNSNDESNLIAAVKEDSHFVLDVLLPSIYDETDYFRWTDDDDHTALYYAVTENKTDITIRLLDYGADKTLNDVDDQQRTLLHHAIKRGLRIMTTILLQYGNEYLTIQPDKNKITPLHYAAEQSNVQFAMAVLDNTPLNSCTSQDTIGNTPLHLATLKGNTDTMSYLLVRCHDAILMRNNQNKTILHMAVYRNDLNAVTTLAQYKALLDVQDIYDKTAMHYAAYYGHLKIVQVLVQHGASQTLLDCNHRAPYDLACERDHWEIATLLNAPCVQPWLPGILQRFFE